MERINILEKLENVPIGTKLYSPICGECSLKCIETNVDYPIVVCDTNDRSTRFREDGLYIDSKFGECLLFPSKDNRDWNLFKVVKPDLERETPVMVSDDGEFWSLAYYYHKGSVFLDGRKDGGCGQPKYIVKASDFDFEDSSSNINKSIV